MNRDRWIAVWNLWSERAAAALRHPRANWIMGGTGAGLVIGILILLYSSAPVVLDEATEKITFFQIGTGASDGAYFAAGSRLAAIISRPPDAGRCERSGPCGVEGLLAVVKSSAGPVANVRAVSAGHFESALIQSTTLDQAYRGVGPFRGEKPFRNLRAIASVYHEAVHLVASRGANVHAVTDLRGKRIAIGAKGSMTASVALDLLRAYGLSTRNVELRYEEPKHAAELMLHGQLDAFFLIAAAPAEQIAGLANLGAVDLVPIDGEPASRLAGEHHQYRVLHVPAGTYGLIPAFDTLGLDAIWVCNAKADPDLIHDIAAALFYPGNRDLLPMPGDPQPHPRKPDKAAEAAMRQVLMEDAVANLPIPLHDGAARFYRDEGVLPR